MFLEQIGADESVRKLFEPYQAGGMELVRVCFAAHEQYRTFAETGECEAALAGRLRWDDVLPAVGDWAAARRVDRELALIEAVLPRRTKFSRRAAGNGVAEQVVAANADLALVVCGLDGDFNLRRMERYLVLAREGGTEPVLVLNKADICDDTADRIEAVRRIAPGVRLAAISARETVEPLRAVVRGRTVVLLGSSGAGKSTIANGLLGEDRHAVSEVRAGDSRGRHTTTSRMLMPLPEGGAIIDNPGMRELQLWVSEESLDAVFHDVSALVERCRFADCAHASEPGCAVREALENGDLDASRWRSYLKLGAELRHRLAEQDVHARAAERKRWRSISRSLRDHPKYKR